MAIATTLPMAAMSLTAATGQAQAATDTVSWSSCATTVKDWKQLTGGDTSMECGTVSVPLDYAKPDGRHIEIAVSRLKAGDAARRRGAMLVNPGGPGPGGLDEPLKIASSGIGDLHTDHDLIGFDPRGTGYSDKVLCPEDPLVPSTVAGAKERAKAASDHEAAYNKHCLAQDPAFIKQLTTENTARDMDAIRAALGEKKIDFYGMSWGTALGAQYRSLFDDKVDRMWLDSVMPPEMDLEAMDEGIDAIHEKHFAAFTEWLAQHDHDYHWGSTAAEVRTSLFALRDQVEAKPVAAGSGDSQVVLDSHWVTGEFGTSEHAWASVAKDLKTVGEGHVPDWLTPSAGDTAGSPAPTATSFGLDADYEGFNDLQNRAVICNDGVGGRDFEEVWANKRKRARAYPGTGGGADTATQCPQWSLPAHPWRLSRGKSALQLSGHLDEDTTPYSWAVAMQAKIGGSLLTVDNADHASLMKLPCATTVVDFFRTGRTVSGGCPSTPDPAAAHQHADAP